MDWQECKFNKFVKEVKVDNDLITSLISSSEEKLKSCEMLVTNSITSSTKVTLFYESLREILEAISLKKGFKIYNHECFVGFLKEVCNEDKFSKLFDKFRIIRNQINYYAKKISVEEATIFMKQMNTLRRELIKKYLK